MLRLFISYNLFLKPLMSEEYESVLKKVHYADVAERYEEMASEILKAVKLAHENKIELSIQARNSFSLAYKNIVSSRRLSWRVLTAERQKNSEDDLIIDEMIKRVISELLKYCDEVLEAIDKYIEISKENFQMFVFITKMKGDYLRYKAEVLSGEEQKKMAEESFKCYSEAKENALNLKSTDPIRLGLFLNFSVFHYEILNDTEEACKLARDAFDTAISELDSLSEDYYKDSTLIMQLLRDNLTLWTSRNEIKKE